MRTKLILAHHLIASYAFTDLKTKQNKQTNQIQVQFIKEIFDAGFPVDKICLRTNSINSLIQLKNCIFYRFMSCIYQTIILIFFVILQLKAHQGTVNYTHIQEAKKPREDLTLFNILVTGEGFIFKMNHCKRSNFTSGRVNRWFWTKNHLSVLILFPYLITIMMLFRGPHVLQISHTGSRFLKVIIVLFCFSSYIWICPKLSISWLTKQI